MHIYDNSKNPERDMNFWACVWRGFLNILNFNGTMTRKEFVSYFVVVVALVGVGGFVIFDSMLYYINKDPFGFVLLYIMYLIGFAEHALLLSAIRRRIRDAWGGKILVFLAFFLWWFLLFALVLPWLFALVLPWWVFYIFVFLVLSWSVIWIVMVFMSVYALLKPSVSEKQ